MVWRTRSHGLSPLARGTRVLFDEAHITCRFIPAGAGNTLSKEKEDAGRPVYPRWRGEHI